MTNQQHLRRTGDGALRGGQRAKAVVQRAVRRPDANLRDGTPQPERAILGAVDPLVELLDRQVDFLLRQTDSAAFLIQVEPFLTALRTEPRLAAYLDDVLEEVVHIVDAMEMVDAELTAELLELRRELVELWPEADDSDVQRPSQSDPLAVKLHARVSYMGTLAYFDEWAGSEPEPFNADGEGGVAKTLLGILLNKATAYLHEVETAARENDQAEQDPSDVPSEDEPPTEAKQHELGRDPLDSWRRRLGNVQRRYDYAVRLLKLRTRTSAGLALLKLEAVPDQLNPPARLLDDDDDDVRAANDLVRWVNSESHSLFKLAWQQSLDAAGLRIIDERVAELRDAVERLREELRRRIGTTCSRLALVYRFKLRCEWHDRDRMLAVADDDRLPGGPEDRLTGEFARYLFDAGLSPLTKRLAGGLQPDLLDPAASFYVEAKQYASSSARADIVKSVAQVLDTVGHLRGGPYAVDEAFCVVFRRDGPYYDLPQVLQTETYRLHLVLVDLAPATAAGRSQQDKPVEIPSAEFFA
jgi:hypothetical protein